MSEGVDYLVKKALSRPWLPIKDAPTDGTEIELYWAPRTKPRILNGKKIADEIVFARIRAIGRWSDQHRRFEHPSSGGYGIVAIDDPILFRYLDADPVV